MKKTTFVLIMISGCIPGIIQSAIAGRPAIDLRSAQQGCISRARNIQYGSIPKRPSDYLRIDYEVDNSSDSMLDSLSFDNDWQDMPRLLRRHIKLLVATTDDEKRDIDLFSGIIDPTSSVDLESEGQTEIGRLKALLASKRQIITQLTVKLSRKDEELKRSISTLVNLQDERKVPFDKGIAKSELDSTSYMAGEMIAAELKGRLDDWSIIGVPLRHKYFLLGLNDGLKNHLQLRKELADEALNSFMQKVQQGTAQKFKLANQKIDKLIGSRKPLLISHGIVWFRVTQGKPVSAGQPIVISMTERISGGKLISKVSPISLHYDDEMPDIIRDGISLPGVGGEVVAYALAETVYGSHPLPKNIQPFTVMEYHLKGWEN